MDVNCLLPDYLCVDGDVSKGTGRIHPDMHTWACCLEDPVQWGP